VRLGERGASLVTFVGVAMVAVSAMAVGARGRLSGSATAAVVGVAILALLGVALARASSPWVCLLVDASLVAAACATGAFVGQRVQHAGHLLPACCVASAADILSVASPTGVTRMIAQSERALSVLALAFPVPGTDHAAPALGVGDLIFCALVLGAAAVHSLPYLRTAVLAFVGVLCAGLLSARFAVPVPAIPTISAAVLLGVPGARRLARKDRTVATIAIGIAAAIVIFAFLTRARG
jgi:hypothetical protein